MSFGHDSSFVKDSFLCVITLLCRPFHTETYLSPEQSDRYSRESYKSLYVHVFYTFYVYTVRNIPTYIYIIRKNRKNFNRISELFIKISSNRILRYYCTLFEICTRYGFGGVNKTVVFSRGILYCQTLYSLPSRVQTRSVRGRTREEKIKIADRTTHVLLR